MVEVEEPESSAFYNPSLSMGSFFPLEEWRYGYQSQPLEIEVSGQYQVSKINLARKPNVGTYGKIVDSTSAQPGSYDGRCKVEEIRRGESIFRGQGKR